MLINGNESPIAIFPATVIAHTCDQLLTEVSLKEAEPGEVLSPGTSERNSRVLFLGHDHWSTQLLFTVAQQANQVLSWGLDLTRCESPQIAFYRPGEHYDWHSDIHSHGDEVRKLTAIVQLDRSEAYAGGDLEIRRFAAPEPEVLELPTTQMRQRGSVLVFPSYQLHRITPVTEGLRRSLVGWILGPRYR